MDGMQKMLRLCANFVRVGFTRPRRLTHILGTALAASEEVVEATADLLQFPQVRPEDLLPPSGAESRAVLQLFPPTNASVSALEFLCLILLLKRTRAEAVFEFGTYKGLSITQLALNVQEGALVCTLDLPEGETQSRLPISHAKDATIAVESGKGGFVPATLRERIQFLRQDSASFDESPYVERMDFVFVDGAHNTEYVRNDSEKGWRMLRSGGIIAWHDCCVADRDVVRYLQASPFKPARITGTSLAFATKP